MRILIHRWKAYNYRDIEQTFLAMGHQVENLEWKLEHYDEDPEFERVLAAKLCSSHFDMVFTVNYFALISNVCERCSVKYVAWTCDNPLISMYHTSVFHPCNYIFTFDKTNYLEFKDMGLEHIWYLPLAVDTDRIDDLLERADDLDKYSGDISFVGSLYERNSYDRLKGHLPDYLRGYFDAVMEAQMHFGEINMIEPMLTTEILEQLQDYFILDKSEGSFSDLGLIFQTTVLGFKIAQQQRRRALIELSKKYKVNVYSNSDVSNLLRIQYRGSVDYWSEMPKVFRASKINLNITIPNIKSGIPLRVWDILGSGGFLMTNYQAEFPLYLSVGKDYACFENIEDLCEKAGYFLTHEEERKKIAESGYRKVKRYHTYRQRIGEMLDIVFPSEKNTA